MACVVSLLGSLEELSQGEGVSQEQVELLKKVEDVDGWEDVERKYSNKTTEDSPQTIPKFTLANEAFDEDENIEVHHGKPKHIRWEMDEGSQGITAQKQVIVMAVNLWTDLGIGSHPFYLKNLNFDCSIVSFLDATEFGTNGLGDGHSEVCKHGQTLGYQQD